MTTSPYYWIHRGILPDWESKDEGTRMKDEVGRMKATTRPEGLLRRRLIFSRPKLGSRLRRRQTMKGRQTMLRECFKVQDCSTLCRDVLHTVGSMGIANSAASRLFFG